MGETINEFRSLVGKPLGKRTFGTPERRWEDNIKMNIREMGFEGRRCNELALTRVQWKSMLLAALNLPVLFPDSYST
jgi:hypothetical protein